MTFTSRQLAAQQTGKANRKHGGWGTPEYRAWSNIKARCTNPRNRSFIHYGGRGITVCGEWDRSFASFLADVGPRPSAAHSIERIDNDSGYLPGNCRWATRTEQQRNKTNARTVEWHGIVTSVAALAESHGLSRATVVSRLERGLSIEDALRGTRMIAVGQVPA